MTDASELHNRIVGDIVRSIVKPPIEAGGGISDIMVVLESTVLGVMLVGKRNGMPPIALDEMVRRVKERMHNIALLDGEPAGRA